MIIYLYGPDSYLREKRVRELTARYEKKYGAVSREVFSFSSDLNKEEIELEAVRSISFLESQSLFVQAKIAVFISLEETPKNVMKRLKLEAGHEADDRLIIVSVPKKLTKEFSFLLEKPVRAEVFDAIIGADFQTFLKDEAKERGLTVTPLMIKTAATRYAGDSWGAVTELIRLSLGGVTETQFKTPDFFPLVQALKNASVSVRLPALTMALEREEPAAIFNVLAALVDFPTKQIMADYDVAIKSGKLEYEEALLGFVLGVKPLR